jgi:DNA polymerase-4
MSGRIIAHVDMDAFYASVEVRADPSLAGKPVVVGGTGGRGVVASASYEARAYGVRSAMPAAQARRLCPRAVFLPPRFDLYRQASSALHTVFSEVTPLVEGIALDEAFLDVSAATSLFGPPEAIAARLRRRVTEKLDLSCSVGVASNKLVAKLASEAAKPRASLTGPVPGLGIVLVTEADMLGFLWPLRVGDLWGVGPASRERLSKLGVATVGELAALPEATLVGTLGKAAGKMLHELAWGRDDRPVVPERAPKSIGHEETYETDLRDRADLERRLAMMADQVAARVRAASVVARTVTVKLRYGNFTTLTRARTFPVPLDSGPALVAATRPLLRSLSVTEGVRLLGVSVSGLLPKEHAPGEQLQLDLAGSVDRRSASDPGTKVPDASDPAPGNPAPGNPAPGNPAPGQPLAAQRWGEALGAVDAVRARFGEGSVRPAAALPGAGGRQM